MRMFVIAGLVLVGFLLIVIAMSPLLQRLIKSVWLIFQVSPYTQVGTTERRILVYGDSTAYGTGAQTSKESIAGRLGAAYPTYSVSTNAVNGRLIRELIPEVAAIEGQVDLLVLQIGGNDIIQNHPPEMIEEDVRNVLTVAKQRAAHVIFMSSGNVGAAPYFVKDGQPDEALEALTRQARDIFISVSAEVGVVYIDLFEEPQNDLFFLEPKSYMAMDGLHPSGAGYGLWFEKLHPAVETLLSRRYEH